VPCMYNPSVCAGTNISSNAALTCTVIPLAPRSATRTSGVCCCRAGVVVVVGVQSHWGRIRAK
jgi:hypothetical protein